MAFLPAALEITDTPPSPTGRAMAITIGLFLIAALAWAIFGQVDIVAVASGSVLPSGMTKVVQAPDTGVVKAIHVQDGDHVRAGETLLELDPTTNGADQLRVSQDLVQSDLDVARLKALANGLDDRADPVGFVAPPEASGAAIAQTRAAMLAQATEQKARLASLDAQLLQKRAEQGEAREEMAQMDAVLPLLEQKDEIHQRLHREGFSTTYASIDSQQQLTASRHQRSILVEKVAQADAAIAVLSQEREAARSEFSAKVLGDLATAQQRRDELRQDAIKAGRRLFETSLRSPVAGVVEQLSVHTVGGVVTPAQRILTVVPDKRDLIVQAYLPNRDVGFVHPGQDVQVKIETFDFMKYGSLPGKVIEVGRDAVLSPQADDPPSPGPAGQELATRESATYVVRIGLNRSAIVVDGVRQHLVPGMRVTADVRTGRRSIIAYLLSPLAKATRESLHEQ